MNDDLLFGIGLAVALAAGFALFGCQPPIHEAARACHRAEPYCQERPR